MTNHEEKILVSRHTGFQTIEVTEDSSGRRILRFESGGASQSVVRVDQPRHLALAYARLLPAGLVFSEKLERMLVVGLGGGSLPRFFHSQFPEMLVDVVELDPAVLEVAQTHCGFVEDQRLHVTVGDGRDHIESSLGNYDVIVLDGFAAEAIPAHLTTLEFLQAVRRALSPSGIVISNIWGPSTNPIYADMLITYQAAFGDVFIFDVPGPRTKLFVSLHHPVAMNRHEVTRKADDLARRFGFEYDLGGEIAGFRNACAEAIKTGVILRD